MEAEKLSMELLYQIWDDNTGEHIEVGPDRDGLDLLEIRQYNKEGNVGDRVTITRGQGRLIAEALQKLTEMV
jgi:hypothetical protein